MKRLDRKAITGLLLVLPGVIITFGVYGYTLVYTLYLSVHESTLFSLGDRFVGLSPYVSVLVSGELWEALRISGIYVGGIMLSILVLGLGLALLLDALTKVGRIFQLLLFVPWIVPGFVAATILIWMVDPLYGVFNYLLIRLGVIVQRVGWLGNPSTALITVMAGVIWKAYPFLMITSVAALQSVPRELYDAVAVDGANKWQSFIHVTLPHLKSVLVTSSLLMFLLVANSIELLYVATEGGPLRATTTLPVHAYNMAFVAWDFGQAAVISTYLLVILLGVIIISVRTLMRRDQ